MFEHCENILDQNNSSAYSENIQVESCLVEDFQWEIPTVKSKRNKIKFRMLAFTRFPGQLPFEDSQNLWQINCFLRRFESSRRFQENVITTKLIERKVQIFRLIAEPRLSGAIQIGIFVKDSI